MDALSSGDMLVKLGESRQNEKFVVINPHNFPSNCTIIPIHSQGCQQIQLSNDDIKKYLVIDRMNFRYYKSKQLQLHINKISGIDEALKGMAFSYEEECNLEEHKTLKYNRMFKRAISLAKKDLGHNKFLESIMIWVDVRASLKFWKQVDTYRLVTKQSKSTMHMLINSIVKPDDFDFDIKPELLDYINSLIGDGKFQELTSILPSGWLQTRKMCFSYKTLRNMIQQRSKHKLDEWIQFINYMKENCLHYELLGI